MGRRAFQPWEIDGDVGVVALALGIDIGFVVRKTLAQSQAQSAEARGQKVILEAERESERITREALVEAKDEASALRKAEEDLRVRHEEVARQGEPARTEGTVDRPQGRRGGRVREELDDRDERKQVRQQLEQAAAQHRGRSRGSRS